MSRAAKSEYPSICKYFRTNQNYIIVPPRYKQTDRRTTYHSNTALCVASRGKKTPRHCTIMLNIRAEFHFETSQWTPRTNEPTKRTRPTIIPPAGCDNNNNTLGVVSAPRVLPCDVYRAAVWPFPRCHINMLISRSVCTVLPFLILSKGSHITTAAPLSFISLCLYHVIPITVNRQRVLITFYLLFGLSRLAPQIIPNSRAPHL